MPDLPSTHDVSPSNIPAPSTAQTSVTGGLPTQASTSNAASQEPQTPSMAVSGPQSTGDTGLDCGDQTVVTPTPQAPIRIRLLVNQTEATGGNKRTSDVNLPTSPAKRQKRMNNTMAEPTTANSIRYAHFVCINHADFHYRNICMRHWKGTQPGRQGLLKDFETHFKSLSDADKQVPIY